ncbi:MAG: hypothetical protein IPL88_04160 [Rhizobiales bacterium]|nr:hypothetical protein [Hyphomicrobiales bacterium]
MRILLTLAALAASVSAYAADLPTKKPAPAAVGSIACKESDAVPPDAFGFAAGSDVAEAGSWGAGLEYGAAFGARVGRAHAHGLKASLSGGLAPCFEIGPSITVGHERASDPTTSFRATSIAAGLEMKAKLLSRDAHGVGLTLVVEPTVAHTHARLRDTAAPLFARGSSATFAVTTKILLDAALVPNRLYGAFNLEYGADATGDNGVDCVTASGAGHCVGSSLNLRAALAYKVSDSLFLGADVAHQRVYEGAFFNRKPGYAWFAGPNLFWAPNETISVNVAWSAQLRGKAFGQAAGQSLNLDDFSRHVVKAKLGVAF